MNWQREPEKTLDEIFKEVSEMKLEDVKSQIPELFFRELLVALRFLANNFNEDVAKFLIEKIADERTIRSINAMSRDIAEVEKIKKGDNKISVEWVPFKRPKGRPKEIADIPQEESNQEGGSNNQE